LNDELGFGSVLLLLLLLTIARRLPPTRVRSAAGRVNFEAFADISHYVWEIYFNPRIFLEMIGVTS